MKRDITRHSAARVISGVTYIPAASTQKHDIQFEDSVRREDLRDLPPGFVIDVEDGHVGTTIRKIYHIEDPMELHIEILKTAIDLTEWARRLEDLPTE